MEEFRSSVVEYLKLIESPPESREAFLEEVQRLLARLVSEALQLPEVEPSGDDIPYPDIRSPHGIEGLLGDLDWYWVTEQPFNINNESGATVGMASLSDDLSEVYSDLKRGAVLWDSEEAAAIFEWRLMFRTHWGVHATSAMWALRNLESHGRK